MTKNVDGSEIFDIKASIKQQPYNTRMLEKRQYAATMVTAEARIPREIAVTQLTCSKCARSKDHSIEGFADVEFKKGKSDRLCLICYSRRRNAFELQELSRFKVCNKFMLWCFLCRKPFSVAEKLTKREMDSLSSTSPPAVSHYWSPPSLVYAKNVCRRCCNRYNEERRRPGFIPYRLYVFI